MNDPKVNESLGKSLAELMVMPQDEFRRHMAKHSAEVLDIWEQTIQQDRDEDDNFYGIFSAEFLRET
jgi:hypothetical protein